MRSPAQERQRQKKAMQRELERRAQLLPNAAHLVGIVPPSQDVQQLRWLQVQCAFRAMFVDELCRHLLAVPELGLLCVATESDAEPRIVEIDVPDIEPDDSAELEPPSPATSRRPTLRRSNTTHGSRCWHRCSRRIYYTHLRWSLACRKTLNLPPSIS